MPDYEAYGQTDVMHDPNYLRTLLTSNNPRIRAQGEEGLRQLQAEEVHHQQLAEFQQREADRQAAHEGNLGVREAALGQQRLAKEELNQRGQATAQEHKTALMAHLLANPQALQAMQGNTPDAAINRAIVSKMLSDARVSVNLPADAKQVALARSKGLPVPQGETLGALQPPQLGQPVGGESRSVPRGAFTGDLAPGSDNQYPVLPNTPEQRFTPQGTGSLYGSKITESGGQTGLRLPSGGFAGFQTPKTQEGIARLGSDVGQPSWSPQGLVAPRMTANQNNEPAFRGHGAGSSWGPTELGSQPPQQVVGSPNPQPNPTPAPGTQFQGPFTAANVPLAPWNAPQGPLPQPALTPPAIPPTKKLTPQELQLVFQQ